MKAIAALFCLLLTSPVWANADPACQEDCLRQGGGYKYCADSCRRPGVMPGAGMEDQGGVPANPAFGQLQKQTQPKNNGGYGNNGAYSNGGYGVMDTKCFKDCSARGYLAPTCQKRCTF